MIPLPAATASVTTANLRADLDQERCDLLLVAHRRPGGTHKFFHGWRVEAALAGRQHPGSTLFSVPVEPADFATPGVHYDLFLVGHRPQSAVAGSTSFKWTMTSPATGDDPDPVATTLTHAQERLQGEGWRPDPAAPTRFRRSPRPSAAGPPAVGAAERPPGEA